MDSLSLFQLHLDHFLAVHGLSKDLPARMDKFIEEAREAVPAMRKAGLDWIPLAAPTSRGLPSPRRPLLAAGLLLIAAALYVALAAPSTAASRLASSRTSIGFLPPSSSEQPISRSAACPATMRPVRPLPVNMM